MISDSTESKSSDGEIGKFNKWASRQDMLLTRLLGGYSKEEDYKHLKDFGATLANERD